MWCHYLSRDRSARWSRSRSGRELIAGDGNAGRDGLEKGPTEVREEGVRNIWECDQRRENSGRKINLPDVVAAAVCRVKHPAERHQAKRIGDLDVVGNIRQGKRDEIREINQQLNPDSVAATI